LQNKAEKAKTVLGKYAAQFEGSEEPAARVFGTYKEVVTKTLPSVPKPTGTPKPNIKDKLNKNTKDVLDKVLAIVEAVLPPDEAALLKTAILKRLRTQSIFQTVTTSANIGTASSFEPFNPC